MEKIKVWDKESKEIFEVAKINFETKEVSYVGSPSGYDVDALFEQVIFLKPTGLQDINGNYIYEGDIVRVKYINYMNTIKEYIEDAFETDIVYSSFECSFGFFNPKYENADMQEINHRSMTIEVIGNIYENPELLERGRGVTQES